ncbi:MAG TPA: MFS transporter [Gemmataceae bacterium]|nr:MFS transporter [Gemmataceae bacterium]
MDEALQKAVMGKVTRRLLPFLFLLYIVNILDRVNVGFAGLRMLKDLGMGEDEFGLGAGIFYLGYLVFEVPSNLILSRTGARRWIARIMVSWGLVTCATMLVRGPWTFYLLRILLGIAEAGFFPGIILYLTYWFPARERARTVAWFMAASPIAGIVGNPLSGAIMEYLNGLGGLRGWQWLFLLEGAPAVILGFVALYYLTDRPEEAGWLTPEERSWLAGRMAREEKQRVQHHGMTSLRALADRRIWLLILLYFMIAAGANAFGFYLPKLIESRFPNRNAFQIGLLAAVPNVIAVVAMLLNGAHSDRTAERRWHVALPAFLSATGWALSASFGSPALTLVALALVQMGVMSMIPPFWSLPTVFLSGAAAAGGIALINSVGNLGGLAGPYILGRLAATFGDFTAGLTVMTCLLCAGGVLALCLRHGRAVEGTPT